MDLSLTTNSSRHLNCLFFKNYWAKPPHHFAISPENFDYSPYTTILDKVIFLETSHSPV